MSADALPYLIPYAATIFRANFSAFVATFEFSIFTTNKSAN